MPSVSQPVSSRAGGGTQTSLFSARCSVHYTTVAREHFRGEIEFELDLIGGITMSTVGKYGVSLRHSEETDLNGAEKALGPEHSEL